MTVTVKPGVLRGKVTVPPSKSLSHRALIAAYLAGRGATVENLAENDDIAATRDCLAAMDTGGPYNCRDSGSTMRFLIPLALTMWDEATFIGSLRLLERPMEPYFDLFAQKGITTERDRNSFTLRGSLPPGRYPLPGNISSQFITGLMFSMPYLGGDSEIMLTSPLESGPYVDLTLQVLESFNIQVTPVAGGWFIPGFQTFRPCHYIVENDESAAAFWHVANALGSDILCEGLNPETRQGDRAIWNIIQNDLREIDVRECPDLVPALAVLCCFRDGESRIINAERLRIKESDRLDAIGRELRKLGAAITELPGGLIIQGVPSLTGGEVVSHNDHRIAMALAVAATRCQAPVTIHGAECVEKSYPDFWDHYAALEGI